MLKYLLLVSALCPLVTACSGSPVRGSASATPALALRAGQIVAAIGVKPGARSNPSADHEAWQDRRVAFGLNNLLAESFYDTGKFRLVEEKNLHQRQLIEELVQLFWSESRPQPTDPELGGIASQLEADLLAYCTVGYSRSTGQRLQLGPVGSYQQRLQVNVEVCLYQVSSQQTLCRAGQGIAQQEGIGVVYEFRNDRPDFEKSATGRATKQAVTSAVQALVASMRFSP